MGIILAALAAVLYGSADFSGGLATRNNSALQVIFVSQILGLGVILGSLPFFPGAVFLPMDLFWGGLAGIAGAVGLAFLYKGIASGIIAIVAPITAVVGTVVPVFVGTLLGQMPSGLGWVGIVFGTSAIFLLAWEPPGHPDQHKVLGSLGYALAAGVSFGIFSILIAESSPDSGVWPLVASRLASVSALFLFLLYRRDSIHIRPGSRIPAGIAGVFDTLANIAFLAATRIIILPIVAVVAGLAPGPTVGLGVIILKQRLGWVRVLGFLFAMIGIGLLSFSSS